MSTTKMGPKLHGCCIPKSCFTTFPPQNIGYKRAICCMCKEITLNAHTIKVNEEEKIICDGACRDLFVKKYKNLKDPKFTPEPMAILYQICEVKCPVPKCEWQDEFKKYPTHFLTHTTRKKVSRHVKCNERMTKMEKLISSLSLTVENLKKTVQQQGGLINELQGKIHQLESQKQSQMKQQLQQNVKQQSQKMFKNPQVIPLNNMQMHNSMFNNSPYTNSGNTTNISHQSFNQNNQLQQKNFQPSFMSNNYSQNNFSQKVTMQQFNSTGNKMNNSMQNTTNINSQNINFTNPMQTRKFTSNTTNVTQQYNSLQLNDRSTLINKVNPYSSNTNVKTQKKKTSTKKRQDPDNNHEIPFQGRFLSDDENDELSDNKENSIQYEGEDYQEVDYEDESSIIGSESGDER